MDTPPKNYHFLLLIIFLVALALRLSFTIIFQGLSSPPDYDAQPDQVEYEQLAFHLSAEKGYSTPSGVPTAHRPPGTSLVLFPIYAVFGHSFVWGRLWFCFLSAITCLATAYLAKQCYGSLTAVVSAVWLAVYPGHFYYAMHFVSEGPYGLFITLACGFTLQALNSMKSITGSDVIAGVGWGIAILIRPQIIFAVPIAWLFLFFSSHDRRRRNGVHLTVQTCLLISVLVPWGIRNVVVMGKPTLSTVGGYTFWGAHNETVLHDPHLRGSWVRTSDLVDEQHPITGTEIEREEAMWRYGFEFVNRNLAQMPTLVAMKIWRMVSPFSDTPNSAVFWAFAVGWLITMPFVLGGIVLGIQNNRDVTVILLIPILATFVSVIVFYGSERFRDSISPLFVIFAARAMVEIVRRYFPMRVT
jgi:4-amino-4-deoxy-L-arabinose transferase-like glycosyltransferase